MRFPFLKLTLAAFIYVTMVHADTPPPVNVYKMKAPGASAVLVANGGAVTPIGPGCTTGYLLTYNGTTWVCAVPPAGGVTSVGLALPTSVFDVTGSPVTSSGTLTAAFDTQAANSFFAGPVSGSPGTPGFRSQVAADVPTITSAKISDFTTAAQAAISGTAPIQVTSGVVSCITATGSVAGCLSAADWTTFNNKGSGTVTSVGGTAPIQSSGGTTPVITCIAATGSVDGCLSATDWNTFNNKQPALGFTAVPNTRTISTTAPLQGGGDLSANRTLTCDVASGSQPGCLASADWTTFNNKQATGLTVLKAGDTMTGTLINSFSGTASNSALLVSGTPFTGGSATTTKPQVNIETSGAVTNNWNTSGTMFGVNAPSGFAGAVADFQVNGVKGAWIDSNGLFNSSKTTENVACGTTGTTRWSCNNTTHGSSTFMTYAINSGALGFGDGTFSNDYMFSMNGGGTATYSAANLTANTAYPALDLRNTNSTTGNFEVFAGSSNSDNIIGWMAIVNVVQTGSSEDGRLVFGTTSAGTRADKMKIEMKGQMTHGGTAPTLTCGTGATVAGNDNVGRVTVGTTPGTTCTITFAATWANAPHCDATDETGAAGAGVTVPCVATTTAAVCTYATLTASDKLSYSCRGFF